MYVCQCECTCVHVCVCVCVCAHACACAHVCESYFYTAHEMTERNISYNDSLVIISVTCFFLRLLRGRLSPLSLVVVRALVTSCVH